MPDQKTPAPPPAPLGPTPDSIKALQALIAKSQQTPPPANTPPPPPPVDTSSMGGLWNSFLGRMKYAIYGPDATQTPPTPAPAPTKPGGGDY